MAHSLFLAHNDTLVKDFPLLVCIGREPNNIGNIVNNIEALNFHDSPRCSFWNISHSVLASVNDFDRLKFKSLLKLENKNSSPIVYTDALVKCIKDGDPNMANVRNSVSESTFKQHAIDIFSKTEIINRAKLILLSGLEHKRYAGFKDEVLKLANEFDIHVAEVPFFFGNNKSKILKTLDEDYNQKTVLLMKDIFTKWKDSD